MSIPSRLCNPARSVTGHIRSRLYSTQPSTTAGPNWLALFTVAGVTGLGAYALLYPRAPAKLENKLETGIKNRAAEKDAANQSPGALGALIKDSWTTFTLSSVEKYNHNSKIYHFEFPADAKDKVSGIETAGALLVKSPTGDGEIKDGKGKPVIRPYTPISSPDVTGRVTLLIKEYGDGKLTPYISSLEPGKGTLLFKGPILKFKYEPNSFDRGLCIAGGSGITPMYQLISHSLGIQTDKTKWTLIFSNVGEKDILLKKEWDSLAAQHPDRLEVKYVLDKAPWGWKGETGFITAPMIGRIFPKGADNVKAFVCGPPPQVKSISGPKDGPRQGELIGALKDLGYEADQVFKF